MKSNKNQNSFNSDYDDLLNEYNKYSKEELFKEKQKILYELNLNKPNSTQLSYSIFAILISIFSVVLTGAIKIVNKDILTIIVLIISGFFIIVLLYIIHLWKSDKCKTEEYTNQNAEGQMKIAIIDNLLNDIENTYRVS